MIRRVLLACLLTAPSAFAAEVEQSSFKASPSIDMVRWLGGLMVVFAAILLLAWALRRLGTFSGLEAGRFKVLAAISLGARERVVLVQAGDKQLVLGVAPGRVQTLCILEGEEVIKVSGVLSTESSSPPFAERLAALLSGKRL